MMPPKPSPIVVRGDDLLFACHGQRMLQGLLAVPGLRYHHCLLLSGRDGRRLAKRNHAATLAMLRAAGAAAEMLMAGGTWLVEQALRQSARAWPRFAIAAAAFQG
jgi:glutamyl/glutaminyl-tRNA synthetase